MRLVAVVVGAGLAALAQPAAGQALFACSQTLGMTAAQVDFGTRAPAKYLEICNASKTNDLGLNATGGAAELNTAGTRMLAPGACAIWSTVPIPNKISVVGSAIGTVTACGFY